MPTSVQKNQFKGGMNKDVDPKQISQDQYKDAYNTSMSQDGREGQAATFKGTDDILNIITSANLGASAANAHLLGVYEAEYLLNNVKTLMALAFTFNDNNNKFEVYAIDINATTPAIYTQFSQTLTADEATEFLANKNMFVDCKIYKEGGKTYAYFSDGVFEPKKLPLAITSPTGKGSTIPYTEEEIKLIRTGFRGNIASTTVATGGDLAAGVYQFSLRLYNNDENKYTKWSLLTQPVFIGIDATTTSKSYGGVGFVTSNKITLNLATATDYTSLYTHYQIAVVENVTSSPEGSLTVKVLQPEDITGFTSTTTFDYTTNAPAISLESIDEVTVDDAAVKTFQTLEIKNNRLIPANIKYYPLDHDNGNPVIADTTAPLQKSFTGDKAVAYRDADNASNYVGHYRDEVYRYGVVYEDEHGNFSKPRIIDFSAVTNNWATVAKGGKGGKDFRFPPRKDGEYGTLLDGNGDIQALGLDIRGLTNHPTWAVAAHIVRVPRKKKILFQTPLIPSILVQPAKAQGDYPAQRSSSDETNLEVLNVEAANPDGTFVPKNFYHVLPKNLVRFGDLQEPDAAANGSVYGSHSNTTIGTYGVIASADYDVLPSTTQDKLFSSNDASLVVTMEKKIGGVYGAFDTGVDEGIFTIKRRVIDGGSFATFGASTIDVNVTGEPEFTGLDLTTYDYLIEFTDPTP